MRKQDMPKGEFKTCTSLSKTGLPSVTVKKQWLLPITELCLVMHLACNFGTRDEQGISTHLMALSLKTGSS